MASANQPLLAWHRRHESVLILLAFASVMASCRQEKTVTVGYDDNVGYRATVGSEDGSGQMRLYVSFIDEKGERSPPVEPSWAADGAMNFSVPESKFFLDAFDGLADRRAAYGNIRPVRQDDYHEMKTTARFELFDPDLAASRPVIDYAQVRVEFDEQAVYGRSRQETSFPLQQAGVAVVKISDIDSGPLTDALVTMIPHAEAGPMRPWENDMYRPVAARTGRSGLVRLFPVPLREKGAAFQIVASAPGYCTFVSDRIASAEGIAEVLEVSLKPCDLPEEEAGAHGMKPAGIRLSIGAVPPAEGAFAVAKAVRSTRVFSNQDKLVLRFDYVGEELRPLSLVMTGGEQGERVSDGKTDWPLSSKVVDLKEFASEGGERQFSFLAGPVYTGDDLDGFGEPSAAKAFATWSKIKPEAQGSQFLIYSSVGSLGVISGLPTGIFRISTAGCPIDGAIAVIAASAVPASGEVDNDSLYFVSCNGALVNYPANQLKLANGGGGFQDLQVIVKDRFGNVSEAGIGGRVEVYLDFSAADVSSGQPVAVGSDFGFVVDAETGAGGDEGGPAAVSLAELKDAAIGFFDENACRHSNPSAGDGPGSVADVGNHLHDWALSDDLDTVLKGKQRYLCSDQANMKKVLKNGRPQAGKPLTLYMHARDLAGNGSNIQVIRIPACSALTDGAGDPAFGSSESPYCWE